MISEEALVQQFSILFNEKISPYLIKVKDSLDGKEELIHGFRHLIRFSSITFYVGKYHLALEYSQFGSGFSTSNDEGVSEIPLYYYFFPEEEEILDQVLGFDDITSKPNFRIPIPHQIENLFVPLGDSLDYMIKSGWNIQAQMLHQSTLMVFGPGLIGLTLPPDSFGRIRNTFFYNMSDSGKLKIRHLKWVDLFPIKIAETEDGVQIAGWMPKIDVLVSSALEYEPPELKKSQLEKLVKLNRFVELINTSNIKETEITQFLAQTENQFILKLYFSSKEIYPEIHLEWQSRNDLRDFRPDFLVVATNGFANIIDFKLPNLEYEPIRGLDSRKQFNAHLTNYIAQLRDYRNYFDDYNNRKYVEDTFGIKVYKPEEYLIIGRRKDFQDDDWRAIEDDYKDLQIITYDDLVDAVTSAVYLIVD